MRTLSIPPRFGTLALCLAAVVATVSPASAQTAGSGKWGFEFHTGGMMPTNPAHGTVTLPAAGQPFSTVAMYPPPAPPVITVGSSRRESSWYFGDGAILFNQAAVGLETTQVGMSTPFPGRIATLDPVLGRSLGERPRDGSIGARVSRTFTPRLSAELSVDYGLGRMQITQANRDAIEATRASFIAAFNGLITANPGRVLKSLTSTAALESGGAHQLFTSGALIVNLRAAGRIVPYATFGASLISSLGAMPRATLTGNYQFLNPSGSPINETDTVTVRDVRERSVGGILGGGVKYDVARRWGIRLDARVSLSRNSASTVLDATPNVALGQLPAGRLVLNSSPTLQFSNNSTDPVTALSVTAVAASTLTGPAISGLRTFSGSGVSTHTSVTAGIFWRF
ncbi:MAG TPA: hypothetical protein VL225_05715 [Vicinamibacterales bacterium]|nr:hypothetical protein [Vicinamibacterales bacterium]